MLSKSKILSGLQCEKRLWLEINRPELMESDPVREARLRAGTEAGIIAHREWPGGVLIEEKEFDAAVALTDAWRANPTTPLFEGAFVYDGVRVRPDALVPNGDGSFDLYEVKGSAEVKPYHEPDVTVQTWVLRQLGLHIRQVHLTHINNQFVYPGGQDYRGLFTHANVTDVAASGAESVPGWITRFREVLAGDQPAIAIGSQCTDPFVCPFHAHCGEAVPQPEFPISTLPRGRGLWRQADRLADEGFPDIRDVPAERLADVVHRMVHQAVTTREPVGNADAGRLLRELGWPRYYLDFETVMFTVPIWAGTRPFQGLPFQWSCHVQQDDGSVTHLEFLAAPDGVPYRAFAESLVAALGARGPVFVYNAATEGRYVRETAKEVPELAAELLAINDRIVDLLPLTRQSWYHPDMRGSWSLKDVLPTIAPELDYSALDGVSDGGAAMEAIVEYTHPETSVERRARHSHALREYCKLDTLALVRLAAHLQSLDIRTSE